MAYGTAVEASGSPDSVVGIVAPSSMKSGWVDIISGTSALATADSAGGLLNPESLAATRFPIWRRSKGTNLLLRVKYSSASTVTTSPIVKVFGRTGADAWDALPSKGGNLLETITCTVATDVTDGTWSYSQINFTALAWDCLGTEKFIVGVSTAIAGSAMTTAVLQAKII